MKRLTLLVPCVLSIVPAAACSGNDLSDEQSSLASQLEANHSVDIGCDNSSAVIRVTPEGVELVNKDPRYVEGVVPQAVSYIFVDRATYDDATLGGDPNTPLNTFGLNVISNQALSNGGPDKGAIIIFTPLTSYADIVAFKKPSSLAPGLDGQLQLGASSLIISGIDGTPELNDVLNMNPNVYQIVSGKPVEIDIDLNKVLQQLKGAKDFTAEVPTTAPAGPVTPVDFPDLTCTFAISKD